MDSAVDNQNSPATLVAIARAANVAGDRELEAVAKRELKDRFGIEITFGKGRPAERRK